MGENFQIIKKVLRLAEFYFLNRYLKKYLRIFGILVILTT